MLLFNKKKKSLENIYNKVVEQSKQSFYLISNKEKKVELTLEFFQLNLILILWYMRNNKLEKNHINYLIKKFILDLENLFIEMGGSETSLRKKIRPIVENFYGRLYSYSLLFDKFYKLNDSLNFKKIIRKNFKYKVNVLLLDSYLKNNLIFLRKLKVLNFWESNFFFANH